MSKGSNIPPIPSNYAKNNHHLPQVDPPRDLTPGTAPGGPRQVNVNHREIVETSWAVRLSTAGPRFIRTETVKEVRELTFHEVLQLENPPLASLFALTLKVVYRAQEK
jgi:hypothetical protein